MKHLTNLDKKLMGLKIEAAFRNDGVDYDEVKVEKAVDRVERDWERAKSERLFKLFGDKLMLTKEILIEKDVRQLAEEVSNLYHPFIGRLKSAIGDAYCKNKISRDLYYIIDSMTFYSIDLGSNRVSQNFEFEMEGIKTFKVNKGQKTLKFFQKLAEIFNIDKDLFEDFRIKHSQVLNDKKIKGTLVLSIHPLDYMTMSDNSNDWDSCMSWDNQGCYRAGTLECMNCPSTIVAYIASKSKEYWLGEDSYWNSKKYRQLVMIDDNAIMTNKGYPYQNDNLSKEVLNFVAELAGEEYRGENYSLDDYVPFEITGLRDIDLRTHAFMYNDIENNARAFFRVNKNFEASSNGMIFMTLGGEAHCLSCGGEIGTEESLYCYSCSDNDVCCDCCGEWGNEDDFYWVDDSLVCGNCFENCCTVCEDCGEAHFDNEMTYFSEEELKNYEDGEHKEEGYYCDRCSSDLILKEEEEEV